MQLTGEATITRQSAHLEDVSLTGRVTITPQFVAKWPRVLTYIDVAPDAIVPSKLTAGTGRSVCIEYLKIYLQ